MSNLTRYLGWKSAALVLLAWIAPANALGQIERMELGRRVQRFEVAWQQGEAAHRARAVEPITRAVRHFFSFNLRAAGKELDAGWARARGLNELTGLEANCTPLAVTISPVVSGIEDQTLALKLEPFYDSEATGPAEATVDVAIKNESNQTVGNRQWKLRELLAGEDWENLTLKEGDYIVQLTVRSHDESFAFPPLMISRIENLEQRVEQLRAARGDKSKMPNATARATIREFVRVVESIAKGEVQETDFPLVQRLRFCERIAADGDLKQAVADQELQNRDLWITLGRERKSVPVRMRIPPKNHPAPVLFLFHGAGGSENMFFETYGAGRAVQLAVDRGWIVVAPRQGFTGLSLNVDEMLQSLEKFVPVDRSRVMLIGHSMGAAQVMNQATINPALPIACVALGGGRRMPSADSVREIKWFVAAGEQDFGRTGARQLHASLTQAGAGATYRDYADVEHLVIVQAALDDVFRFLDEVVASVGN